MIVTQKQFLAVCLLIATVLHTASAAYNITAQCLLVKSGTKLPSTESCANYYVCQNQGYTENICDNGYSFDKDRQSCQPAANVDCFYGLANPCLNKNVSFVPQVGTCGGWIYCSNNAEAGRGNCPSGTVFKSGDCVYGDCINEADKPDTSMNICDVMPINTFFGNSVDCSQYQVCTQDQAVPVINSCTNGLMYDVQINLCNYKSNTDCSRVTNQETPIDNEPCPEEGATKPSEIKCSEYYSCIDNKWKVQSCKGLFWDTRSNKCVGRQAATSAKNCDRCEGTSKQFVNAVDPKCLAYTVCANGKKINAGNCDSGYFDESAQACIETDAVPTAYANLNGACASAPLNNNCECGEPNSETKECATDDNCVCGLDEDDKTKCVECTDGIVENGVCKKTQQQTPETTTAEEEQDETTIHD